MDQNRDILSSDSLEPEPEIPAPPRQKGLISRFRSAIFRILIFLYILVIIASGYWYLSRPVRPEQISHAYKWWSGVAEIYNIPVPEDRRYQ